MTELEKTLKEIALLDIVRAVFSCPYTKDEKYVKCTVRPIKDAEIFQFESFTKTQAFHENVSKDMLCEKFIFLLSNTFRQAEIFTQEYVYGLKISSKGKLLHNKRKNTQGVKQQTAENNRQKNHIIDLDNTPQVFTDIGIIGKDGKIINSRYDKYKQICRFCEFIDDVVKNDPREEYFIVDFGCGKSYLTFVCYHYMTKIAGKKVKITGLDLKEKVIEDCNALAKKYGYDNLSFLCMDIKDYCPDRRPDMVIALHACDTATDYALYNAYLWQTDYIFSVPCCQHEMNGKVKTEHFSLITDYGLIKERFCALATDALRGKTLEYCGYKTDVLEFIDEEHSPKNILLRSVRTTRIDRCKRGILLEEISRFENEFNAKLFLHSKIAENEYELEINGENFKFVIGKASMLLKDAMTLRSEVFGREQNYKKGSCRDNDDETALFVNVYTNGQTVATSRLIKLALPDEMLVGKIAVKSQYRKYGIGKAMLRELCKQAKNENIKTLHVIAQKQAMEFYEKMGFCVCGNEYEEESIAMIPMKKNI
ncbi:MAG: GNAT family N-acetyltransferase [Clostridia bacterium]|nr:GNAT family N-acetyltransferase [Clostridia bacterium]